MNTAAVAHLQEQFRAEAERIHAHTFRGCRKRKLPEVGWLDSRPVWTWCDCGRNAISIGAKLRGERCSTCKELGSLKRFGR